MRENFKDSSAVISMVPSFIIGVIIYYYYLLEFGWG